MLATTFADSITAWLGRNGPPLLIGGVTGGLLGASATLAIRWLDRRAEVLRELLAEGLKIYALREAWILDGPEAGTKELDNHKNLPTRASQDNIRWPWLRQVEVRAALDQAEWNSPGDSEQKRVSAVYYGFLDGRRAWIVRNKAQPKRSYGGPDVDPKQPSHPALLSSQAMHELCAWIERVAIVPRRWVLGDRQLRAFRYLLSAVAGDDRIAVFGDRLTTEAVAFLRWYHSKYSWRV